MYREEQRLLQEALLSISRRYKLAYNSLMDRVPDILEAWYKNDVGYKDVQNIINNELARINEFYQLSNYNDFFSKAYLSELKRLRVNYGLKYDFSQIDTRTLEAFQSANNWFTSKYQTLTDQEQTLKEMKLLWESGDSIKQASEKLNNIFENSNKRINAYTQTTLITNNTRIRTLADLNNFKQNNIEKYQFVAVLDKVTTDLCEELNGEVYEVGGALDYQKKVNQDVSDIINKGKRDNLPDWQVYNNAVTYLQKNDALASKNDNGKWSTTTILRTDDPEIQGKKTTKNYKSLSNVPGNKFPRPPLHYNCRSRLVPVM